MKVTLEVIKGPSEGRIFEFDGHESFIVGREKNNSFRIKGDLHFSRYHFLIESNPPKCLLRDLGSMNGTFVNDKKLGGKKEKDKNNPKEIFLKNNDIIRCGMTEIKIFITIPKIDKESIGALTLSVLYREYKPLARIDPQAKIESINDNQEKQEVEPSSI